MNPEKRNTRLRKAERLARQCGWREPFHELPEATRQAFLGDGEIRISQRDTRKRFGKSSGKRLYGHFSGYCQSHMTRQDYLERCSAREALAVMQGDKES
jgi:hypothetical protein